MAINTDHQTNVLTIAEHASAPGTPASGSVALYAKTDGLLYSKDDAGAEVLMSAVVVGKQTIWVPAGSMTPRTTSGAAEGTTETTTNKIMLKTLDFDQTTDEFAQFQVGMPKSWDEGTVSAIFYWTAAAGTGTVTWGLQAVAVSNDDVLDAAFGTPQTVNDTLLATGDNHITAETSAITIAGTPTEGDLVTFEVFRDPDTDTLTADAQLLGVKLFYTTNATTDA